MYLLYNQTFDIGGIIDYHYLNFLFIIHNKFAKQVGFFVFCISNNGGHTG
jgi:hypothetical protein